VIATDFASPEFGSDFGLAPRFERCRESPDNGSNGRLRVDEVALHGYLCFGHVLHTLSIFAGFRRIDPLPGCWEPRSDLVDERTIEGLLHASVDRCASAYRDSPIGLWLSGGLDSAVVGALLVRQGYRPIAFTLDFGPPWNVEVDIARRVSEHLGIRLQLVDARPERIAGVLDRVYASLPEPFGDPVVPPLQILADATARETSVAFNGEGGDQLFGGWANKPMVAAASYGSTDEVREYLSTYHRFHGAAQRLYSPKFFETIRDVDPAEWVARQLDPTAHPTLLHRLRAANLALKGAQNIAPRCRAIADCSGIAVRCPFMDRELAEATFSLPESAFLQGALEKPVLRAIARRMLPPEVVDLPKRGMSPPTVRWCQPDSAPGKALHALLSSRSIRREGRFDPAVVASLLEGSDVGSAGFRPRRAAEKTWCLAAWEFWRTLHRLD